MYTLSEVTFNDVKLNTLDGSEDKNKLAQSTAGQESVNHMPELSSASRAALVELVQQSSMEVFPSDGVEKEVAHLPKGTKVAVTCSPKRGIETTLRLSEQLAEQGLRPIPHISARLVRDSAHVAKIGQRLAQLDINEIFVIGGDSGEPEGPFPSSHSLLTTMADMGFEFERVGVAAYPEGHPLIEDDVLFQALRDKQPFATYMATQMCFDAGVILDWIAQMRMRGIELPVHVGIPGVADRLKLAGLALRIGVGESAHFLRKHSNLVGKVLSQAYSPGHLVDGLAPHSADPHYDIQGFHIYTFNQVEATQRWRSSLISTLTADAGKV